MKSIKLRSGFTLLGGGIAWVGDEQYGVTGQRYFDIPLGSESFISYSGSLELSQERREDRCGYMAASLTSDVDGSGVMSTCTLSLDGYPVAALSGFTGVAVITKGLVSTVAPVQLPGCFEYRFSASAMQILNNARSQDCSFMLKEGFIADLKLFAADLSVLGIFVRAKHG